MPLVRTADLMAAAQAELGEVGGKDGAHAQGCALTPPTQPHSSPTPAWTRWR
jgi:hypothetical protein